MKKPEKLPTKAPTEHCFLCQEKKPLKEIYTLTAPNKDMRALCGACINDFIGYIKNGTADEVRANRPYDLNDVPF